MMVRTILKCTIKLSHHCRPFFHKFCLSNMPISVFVHAFEKSADLVQTHFSAAILVEFGEHPLCSVRLNAILRHKLLGKLLLVYLAISVFIELLEYGEKFIFLDMAVSVDINNGEEFVDQLLVGHDE